MSLIYLSGTESEKDFDILNSIGCKHILQSYMHLAKGRKGKSNSVVRRVEENPGLKIFIDSGCYTLRTEPDYLDKKGKTPRQYIEEYLEWLYAHAEHIACAVNYDMWETQPEITEWADEKFKKFEADTGVPIIYVWHSDYGPAKWLDFCERHSYIGFSYADAEGLNISTMLAVARKHGTKVHGFGVTDTENLGNQLFYSVDSTTWVMGAKYGRTMAWTGSEFRQFDGNNKSRRNQYRAQFIKRGVDWDLIEADTRGERGPEIRAECIKMNALAWMDFQAYVQQRISARAYWNVIDATIERIPDVDQLTKQEILAFFEDIDYGSNNTEIDALKDEVIALFAFASANQPWIEGLTDEDVKSWAAYFLGDQVLSKTTDRYKLIADCRIFAVNILAPPPTEAAKERTGDTLINEDIPRPLARTKEEDLPKEIIEAEFELVDSVEGLTEDEVEAGETEDNEQGSQPQEPQTQAQENTPSNPRYPDFIQGLEDETLRLRACLLVDSARRANDLSSKVKGLRLRRDKENKVPELKKQWRAASAEKKFLSKQLPADVRKKILEWVKETGSVVEEPSGKKDEPEKKQLMTSERAREIGKLGGAPKGNKNAIKHGLYSKKMPALSCDACPIAGQCYMYRQGHVCAFDKEFKKLKVNTVEDAKDAMVAIVNTDLERLQRQLLFETVQGGVANTDTSNLVQQVFTRAERVKALMQESDPNRHVSVTRSETVSGPQALMAKLMQKAENRKPTESDYDIEADRAKVAKKVLNDDQ